jgi:hypothetical protein
MQIEELPVTANKISTSLDPYPTKFTTFCSKFIISPLKERRQICFFDISKRAPKIQVSSPTHSKIRSFDQPKHRVHMGEVDGKLYSVGVDPLNWPGSHEFRSDCIIADPLCELFEVFDDECLLWRPLPAPPFVSGKYILGSDTYRSKYKDEFGSIYGFFHNFDTRFLDESKKILGGVTGELIVFCFDVTNPGNNWTQLDNPCLLNTIPGAPNPLFIHIHHSDIGDFYLVFTYKPQNEPLLVCSYFMSNTFDSFRPINQSIHLPELCIRYIQSGCEINEMETAYTFQLLHLGDQNVGLAISTYLWSRQRVRASMRSSSLLRTPNQIFRCRPVCLEPVALYTRPWTFHGTVSVIKSMKQDSMLHFFCNMSAVHETLRLRCVYNLR